MIASVRLWNFTPAALAVLLAFGCRGSDHAAHDPAATIASAADRATPPSDTVAIDAMVSSVERYTKRHPDHVELFAHVPGRASLARVKDTSSWPEHADTSYNLWRDSAGRPIKYVAMPASESGDWFAAITYWFDPDGRTILYEYSVSSFEGECTEILRETKRIWLDRRGAPIARANRYTDADGRPVRPEKCYRLSDTIPPPRLRASDLAHPHGSASR